MFDLIKQRLFLIGKFFLLTNSFLQPLILSVADSIGHQRAECLKLAAQRVSQLLQPGRASDPVRAARLRASNSTRSD